MLQDPPRRPAPLPADFHQKQRELHAECEATRLRAREAIHRFESALRQARIALVEAKKGRD